jgi:hypothetical protein
MNSSPDLFELQRLRGGTVYDGGRRWIGPGPGHSRSDQSLSLWITDDGRPVVHSFAGDPFEACLRHLEIEHYDTRGPDRFTVLRNRAKRAEETQQRAEADLILCARIWTAAVPTSNTLVETYLRSRHLMFESSVVRFHPAAPRSKRADDHRTWPAMVCLIADPVGQPQAIHLTYLAKDGRGKAFGDRSRVMFGATKGCAVQLDPVDKQTLAVAEGVETSIAFAAIKDVSTWAALSTSGLRSFRPPNGIRRLLIAADSDDGGAGLQAAKALAERVRLSCEVEIHPAPSGKDWNDLVRCD